MDWKSRAELPKPAVPLWGWSTSRGPVVCKLVVDKFTGMGYRFIDDKSMPVHDIKAWAYAVAPGETP